jgi:hemolysin III
MAAWAFFATLILARVAPQSSSVRIPVLVFGFSMVALYLASGAYHGSRYLGAPTALVLLLQKSDKTAIFMLIAGSYTPIFARYVPIRFVRPCLWVVWGTAVFGSLLVWLWNDLPHEALVGIYVLMGVGGFVLLPLAWARIKGWPLLWITAFCGAYLVGAAAEVAQWPVLVPGYVGPHEVLHIADIVGSMIYFSFVVKYVLPAAEWSHRRMPDSQLARP